jgi:phosphoketolase
MAKDSMACIGIPAGIETLDGEVTAAMLRYRRAANFLSAAQIYLCANPLIESHSSQSTSKTVFSGIGAPRPVINFIY